VNRLIGILFLLVAAGIGAGAYFVYARANAPFQAFQADQVVEIPSGAGSRTIGETLIAAGVVRDELTFRVALWLSGSARKLQAGEYRFDRPQSAVEVIGKISRGEVDLQPLTFPEGLTIAEMAKVFEASGRGTAASFIEAARNPAAIKELDPAAANLEGYLFPDTYSLPRRADAARIVRIMADRFQRMLTDDIRSAARARGLSVRQLVTLASLVEKETARPEWGCSAIRR
jgi:UPF0755 protein